MNTTKQTVANPVTLMPSTDGTNGLISFTICRGEFRSEEGLEELLTLLAALSNGVVGVVRQHLPDARVEVGLHHERMTNHYVLCEVFSRTKAAHTRAEAVSPSSPALAGLHPVSEFRTHFSEQPGLEVQAPLDSAPDTCAQSVRAACCHQSAQPSLPGSSLSEKFQP
ncbi:hypothetical protein [Comamonas sp. CMM02]|uniref:hypothetical protein n=1 Tax=Comamonas sp. CMM02 TaxID=2769307 RepID=UPI00177C99DB|nr:hypothetical protein [Comamonas sp. CMM02]MBD9400823.1 hypothetical protein [Comamonas sp. CMM02]